MSAGVAASGNSFSEPVSEKNVHCIMVLYGILWYYIVLYGIYIYIHILYSWYYWYQVTPTTAAAAAAISQQLSQPGKAKRVSGAGIKYPVRGIPHSDETSLHRVPRVLCHTCWLMVGTCAARPLPPSLFCPVVVMVGDGY